MTGGRRQHYERCKSAVVRARSQAALLEAVSEAAAAGLTSPQRRKVHRLAGDRVVLLALAGERPVPDVRWAADALDRWLEQALAAGGLRSARDLVCLAPRRCGQIRPLFWRAARVDAPLAAEARERRRRRLTRRLAEASL